MRAAQGTRTHGPAPAEEGPPRARPPERRAGPRRRDDRGRPQDRRRRDLAALADDHGTTVAYATLRTYVTSLRVHEAARSAMLAA